MCFHSDKDNKREMPKVGGCFLLFNLNLAFIVFGMWL